MSTSTASIETSTLKHSKMFENPRRPSPSPPPSYVGQKTSIMASGSSKRSWFKGLFSCFTTSPPAAVTEKTFAPSRPAPLCVLPPRQNVSVTVSRVRITSSRCTSITTVAGKTEVCMQARVRVTVTACCRGPSGTKILSKKSEWGQTCCGIGVCASTKIETLANATVKATEVATTKSYEDAVWYATADAIAAVEKAYAKQATKALYSKLSTFC